MIVRISNLDASPLYYSAAVIPASRGGGGGGEARRPPPESSKAYDRERLLPIVTRNSFILYPLYPSIFALSSFSLITGHTYTKRWACNRSRIYTCTGTTHARERDASRAAALNYRHDAILMRSIIYVARHRPLNIPRSTKESSRYPRNYSGPVFANSTEVRARHSHRAAIFASS